MLNTFSFSKLPQIILLHEQIYFDSHFFTDLIRFQIDFVLNMTQGSEGDSQVINEHGSMKRIVVLNLRQRKELIDSLFILCC